MIKKRVCVQLILSQHNNILISSNTAAAAAGTHRRLIPMRPTHSLPQQAAYAHTYFCFIAHILFQQQRRRNCIHTYKTILSVLVFLFVYVKLKERRASFY
jgi:hypothetical protein